jgi:hypothetical protein
VNDLGHGGEPILDADLPVHYQAEAARLRCDADLAETVEMRITLLKGRSA